MDIKEDLAETLAQFKAPAGSTFATPEAKLAYEIEVSGAALRNLIDSQTRAGWTWLKGEFHKIASWTNEATGEVLYGVDHVSDVFKQLGITTLTHLETFLSVFEKGTPEMVARLTTPPAPPAVAADTIATDPTTATVAVGAPVPTAAVQATIAL